MASPRAAVRFGVVVDGPSFYNDTFRPRLQNEILDLLGTEFDARFPDDKYAVADWSRDGISAAMQRLLDDPEVDMVLTFGAIASQLAAEYGPLPKPVVAPFVLDADVQELPLAGHRVGDPTIGSDRDGTQFGRQPESAHLDESLERFGGVVLTDCR